jgi:CubicO group peptidase (beta-lactamase class C family)
MTDVRVEAQPEDVGMSAQGLRNVTRIVQRYVDEGRIAGAISLVGRRGKVVHLDVQGQSDVERGLPMAEDTIFRIYSMTKPIASVGLMMLYEEGRLQLDDPVSDYLPELADLPVLAGGDADSYDIRAAARPMTVRDILMHTSGLVASTSKSVVGDLYRRADVLGSASGGTLADLVTKLSGLPLQSDPGDRWIYGVSTDLVGRLCEVLSGLPFDVYLRQRIFEPLEMTDTGFAVPSDKVARFAACYEPTDGGGITLNDNPVTSPYSGVHTYFSGAGGLVSTTGDYLRFTRMLAAGGTLDGVRIIGPRTLRFMTVNHLPGNQDLTTMAKDGGETRREGQGFGLGFGVLIDQRLAQTVGTPGEYSWGGAASTGFFVSPADDLFMIFMTQLRTPPDTYPIRRQLRAAIYGAIDD